MVNMLIMRLIKYWFDLKKFAHDFINICAKNIKHEMIVDSELKLQLKKKS